MADMRAAAFSLFRQVYRYFTITAPRDVTRKLWKAILIVIYKISKLQRVRCKFNDNAKKLALFSAAHPTYAS